MRYLAALSLVAFAPFLSSALRAAPANDSIQNAIELSSHQLLNRAKGNVTGVTADGLTILLPGSQTPTSGYLFPSIWYRWTAPVAGKVLVQGVGYNFAMWGTTLQGPLGQAVYPVAGTDVGTTLYGGASTMSYEYPTTPGTTYYNAIECSVIGSPNSYNYVHRFVQDALSDAFSSRTQMGGVDFTVFGNNATFTVEEGEPDHAFGSQQATDKSVWTTWRSPNSRKFVTLEVKAKTFAPVLAVYTGDSLATLKLVTRSASGSSGNDGFSAVATFIAEDAVDFHIAIDGSNAKSGAFTLKVKADTLTPGFITAPVGTTVHQGETATFTATATFTGETVEYQWQRLPAGTKKWLSLDDDATFSGTKTSALSVITTLEMNKDRYRVLAKDVVGTSASRAGLLTVTEFAPVRTEVLGTVLTNISLGTIPEPTNSGSYFATGLPKGLSINPETGEITGVIDAKPGTYRVTYGSTDGKKKNPEVFILLIIVDPLSTHLAGAFEALIDSPDALATPEAKLSFKVTGNGRFTGSYFDLREGRAYPFKGALVLNQSTRTASNPADNPVQISRGGARTPLFLEISMVEPAVQNEETIGSTLLSATVVDSNDTLVGQSVDGAPVSRFSGANPAPWASKYTLRLAGGPLVGAPESAPPIPIGSSHATGVIADKTGVLVLRGRLADNTQFTANLASSPDATYRLGQRVYGPGGILAGRIKLIPQLNADLTTLSYHSDASAGSSIFWAKPARPKDKLYPEGFGGGFLTTSALMEPWSVPAGGISASLGLAAGGAMKVQIVAAVPQDGNDSNPYGLPVEVRLSAAGALSFVSPSTNNTKFALKITPGTGAFTGTYELAEATPLPGVKPRKVTFSGVLVQNAVVFQGDVIGEGFAIVPPLLTDEIQTSASIKFLAGPPESPFGVTPER